MASVGSKLRRSMIDVREGKPGHRFQAMHERTKRSGRRKNTAGRALRISAAIVAFTIGVVLVVIPGPAIPFFFVAGGLLATESRWVARGMDCLEVRGREIFRWAARRWHRLGMPARIALIGLAVAGSILSAVVVYRFIRD